MCLGMIFNFQFSIFNSIETHQLHIVNFQRCNVSRLYNNFQFSTFNFQLSIRLRRTNYIVFILNGVMCHVSTIIFNFQLSTFNLIRYVSCPILRTSYKCNRKFRARHHTKSRRSKPNVRELSYVSSPK